MTQFLSNSNDMTTNAIEAAYKLPSEIKLAQASGELYSEVSDAAIKHMKDPAFKELVAEATAYEKLGMNPAVVAQLIANRALMAATKDIATGANVKA